VIGRAPCRLPADTLTGALVPPESSTSRWRDSCENQQSGELLWREAWRGDGLPDDSLAGIGHIWSSANLLSLEKMWWHSAGFFGCIIIKNKKKWHASFSWLQTLSFMYKLIREKKNPFKSPTLKKLKITCEGEAGDYLEAHRGRSRHSVQKNRAMRVSIWIYRNNEIDDETQGAATVSVCVCVCVCVCVYLWSRDLQRKARRRTTRAGRRRLSNGCDCLPTSCYCQLCKNYNNTILKKDKQQTAQHRRFKCLTCETCFQNWEELLTIMDTFRSNEQEKACFQNKLLRFYIILPGRRYYIQTSGNGFFSSIKAQSAAPTWNGASTTKPSDWMVFFYPF